MVSHVDGGPVFMPTILFGVHRERGQRGGMGPPAVCRGILDARQFDAPDINAVDQLTPGAIFEVGRNSRASNFNLPMPEIPTLLGTARYGKGHAHS
ncbi:hypothetical protein EYC80_009233 [Monilinia laxa]|uniref:Uncharacterized protein n=1 Tax=Monilinia laxa TaxID=61186 RepID=A0A5N6JX82_MONLA|nr:hypothetical protein EYC80_009233 [Monilinia laxa]